MAIFYQNDFLTTLAYLMGEKTVNSSTSAPRADFIQSALHDAYGDYPWIFARNNTVLTIASTIATLPADYDPRHYSRAYIAGSAVGDLGTRLDPVSDWDKYQVQDGDRAMWIEPISGTQGQRFQLVTKDSDVTTLNYRYQGVEPTLDSAGTTGTAYPNKRTIALGARIYVKLGQNPDADVSQEEGQFKAALAKDVKQYMVQEPRRRRRTAQNIIGSYTGEF